MKMEPLHLADGPIERFFQLASRGPVTCYICLGELGRELGFINDSQARELRDMEEGMRKLLATFTPEE